VIQTILLIIFTLFFFKGFAQDQQPPAYLINNDTITYFEPGKEYWRILEDKNDAFTITQVSSSAFENKFHLNPKGRNVIDYSIHSFWIRYRLKNVTTQPFTICFLNNNLADQTDFYISANNNEWLHKVTGNFYPLDKRDGLKKNNIVPFTLNPGEEVIVFNNIRNSYYINKPDSLSVKFGNYRVVLEQYNIDEEKDNTINSLIDLFYGIYLFGFFLYLFFFLVSKERLHLYYSLFLGWLFSYFEPLQNTFFPNHLLIYASYMRLANWAGLVLYTQFLRAFFKTSIHTPKWDKFLNALCLLVASSVILSFFIEPHLTGKLNFMTWYINAALGIVILSSMTATFLLYRHKKNASIPLLMISGLPVIIYEIFVGSLRTTYYFLSDKLNIETPKFVAWLQDSYFVINSFLLAWLAIVFSWILFQRFLQLQKKNAEQAIEKLQLQKEKEIERSQLIEQQKIELEVQVTERTAELKHSLNELRSTQAQLIQSEKMASLGELTAGIAHEIQNPLNFVNNFSEVNREMVDEATQEIDKGNYDEVKLIVNDIKDNSEKINHHGKRADAIVKSMLEHSRTSTGVKELTDINKLADEYLRLAYHGLRAKDKSFNTELKTDFDEKIGKINVIPQDIGRVLLNLLNNAFYAVSERAKLRAASYEPRVIVQTKKINGKIEIRVSDNGNGIPQNIVDKIFQPFFTTKPTGQGTGLGLSLAYDIIKAHGGEIKVNTKESEGSEFTIILSAE
jgi:signal transduction histidine kinase